MVIPIFFGIFAFDKNRKTMGNFVLSVSVLASYAILVFVLSNYRINKLAK